MMDFLNPNIFLNSYNIIHILLKVQVFFNLYSIETPVL